MASNLGNLGSQFLGREYKHASIVVIGNFNPAIFHPEWFKTQAILPEIELELESRPGATSLVVSGEICSIHFRSLRLDVFLDRWSLGTERPDWFGDLGAVVKSIFKKLPHTPVNTVGLNVVEHIPLPEGGLGEVLTSWLPCDRFGEVVGPNPSIGAVGRAEWNEFMSTVTMQASISVKGGIYVAQNFERKIKNVDELADLLDARWSEVLERSKAVTKLLTQPRKEST